MHDQCQAILPSNVLTAVMACLVINNRARTYGYPAHEMLPWLGHYRRERESGRKRTRNGKWSQLMSPVAIEMRPLGCFIYPAALLRKRGVKSLGAYPREFFYRYNEIPLMYTVLLIQMRIIIFMYFPSLIIIKQDV